MQFMWYGTSQSYEQGCSCYCEEENVYISYCELTCVTTNCRFSMIRLLTDASALLMYVILFLCFSIVAPIKDVQSAVKEGTLGPLNPTPWAVMTGNCIGWIVYSYLIQVSNVSLFD